MRNFSARETEWLLELDGIELAAFWPRAFAFVIDWTLICIVMTVIVGIGFGAWVGIRKLEGKSPMPDAITSAVSDKSSDKDLNIVVGPGFITPKGEKQTETGKLISDATDIVIPIRAAVLVHKPAAFAVTAEKPGGVVVSDRAHVIVLGAAG